MKRNTYTQLHRLIAAAVVMVIIIAVILQGSLAAPLSSYAASYVGENEFDTTAVLDDLQSSDSSFNVSDYAFNEKSETQVIAFSEYCYSYYSTQRGNYALYIYVWNPKGLNIVSDSSLNYISLRFGGDTSANYNKYRLYFCNCSTGDYQGLFYKFKVYLSSDDKTEIFETLNSLSRVYEVSEIELLINGNTNATAVYVSTKYTYSGFAAGYGSNNTTASTLTCTEAQGDTLSLNVNSTYYRPDNNSSNEYTQDSLHSVYFSVPTEYIETYGYMSKIHATWRDAVLNPSLVTGNSDAASAISNYLGVDIGEGIEDLDYSYAYNATLIISNPDLYIADYAYNYVRNALISGSSDDYATEEYLSILYMLFKVSDADTAYIDGDTIINKLLSATKEYGGTLINGKYSSCLFESVADNFTEVNISADDEYSLTSATYSQSFWQKYFTGGYTQKSSTTFDGIKAIYEVTDNDFTGTASENAAALYINENDYSDFLAYYTSAKANGETVYLFRYQVTDYISREMTLYEWNDSLLSTGWNKVDTNAYIFQETVNLDFDIIDVTFSNGETETVIGVCMSPIDVVSSATPPVNTTDDNDDDNWLTKILSIVALVLLCVLFAPVLPYAAKLIVWIISLPFKLINAIKEAASNSSNKKNE